MADVELDVQTIGRDGEAPDYTSPLLTTNTYRVHNNGRTVLHFKKTGAGACNVTFTTPRTVGGLAVADQVVAVPATTGDVLVSDLPPSIFNQPGEDYLEFTLSEVTGLSVACFQVKE